MYTYRHQLLTRHGVSGHSLVICATNPTSWPSCSRERLFFRSKTVIKLSLSGPGSIHMASRRNLPDVQTELGQIAVMQLKAIRLAAKNPTPGRRPTAYLFSSSPTCVLPCPDWSRAIQLALRTQHQAAALAANLPSSSLACVLPCPDWVQKPSGDVKHSDDSDSDELPARLRSMTLTSQAKSHLTHHHINGRHPYPCHRYSAPTEQRLTNLWSEAGAASQGVPGGHVHIVTQHRAGTARRGKAICRLSRPAMWGIRLLEHHKTPGSWPGISLSTSPRPWNPIPLHPGENIQDNKWYIVYKGICPGVYRSYLESQLNVKGISAATHESVAGTKDFAIAKYLQAVEDGDVAVISPSYTRYI
ncbi:hypothetical protein B0H14DRAFT_2631871 [Mycena olivaceomarginata]|nr:hypothetical protein B0H14DRAFT_2631871 [Mycena olivaceomarginata]